LEAVAILEDEVDFAAVGAEVAGEEFKALPSQILLRSQFALCAPAQMLRARLAGEKRLELGQKIHRGQSEQELT
jgi:hypothetical protein